MGERDVRVLMLRKVNTREVFQVLNLPHKTHQKQIILHPFYR